MQHACVHDPPPLTMALPGILEAGGVISGWLICMLDHEVDGTYHWITFKLQH